MQPSDLNSIVSTHPSMVILHIRLDRPDRSTPPAQEAAPGIKHPGPMPSASVLLNSWPRLQAHPACATSSCSDMLRSWLRYLIRPCFWYGTGERVQFGSEMKPVDSGALACCASPQRPQGLLGLEYFFDSGKTERGWLRHSRACPYP